jgi:hypothetical protein
MARKSKPWAVVLLMPGGPTRTEHRSQPEAYRKVIAEREQAKAGTTRVTKIRVEQWDPDGNRWALYELINPKES